MASGPDARIAAHRQFFAELVTADVTPPQPALVEAFRTTPREAFLGPGPWYAFTGSKSVSIPTDDPAFVYQDVVIRLKGDINNGQPSLHAMCLGALKVQPGETAIHIGAGHGYYTAILAQLVGPHGRVHAYEVDLELAARASQNLRPFPQVTVHPESAVGIELPKADVVYVNAGASHVPPNWLDALNDRRPVAVPARTGVEPRRHVAGDVARGWPLFGALPRSRRLHSLHRRPG